MNFSNWQLRQACLALQNDGVIAYPTEAVFGVGCDPSSETAIIRLLMMKRRPLEKGLILLSNRYRLTFSPKSLKAGQAQTLGYCRFVLRFLHY